MVVPAVADLHHARRAQRLRADQMAVPRPHAGLRADAVCLLHPVPVGAAADGDRSSARSAGSAARCRTSTGSTFGLGNPTVNLVFVHVVYGLGFTTLFFRNYYEAFPTELVKAAQIDGAGFFQIFRRILLPNSLPIFVVTVIYQFTNIWNDFLFGAVLRRRRRRHADDGGAEQRRQHLDRRGRIQRQHGGRDDRRPAPPCSSTSSPAAISCAA